MMEHPLPDDGTLLALCDLPADSAPDVVGLLRTTARLVTRSTRTDRRAAVVALAAAMGHAIVCNVQSMNESWIRRDDLARKFAQLGGLLVGSKFIAIHADMAILDAVKEYWLREEEHDAWTPGMRSGSGWMAIVQAEPVGIARAIEMANMIQPQAPKHFAPSGASSAIANDPLEPDESLRAGYRDPDNYWRNVWLYEQRKSGRTNAAILEELAGLGTKYAPLYTENALRTAIASVARYHCWLELRGRPGRRKLDEQSHLGETS